MVDRSPEQERQRLAEYYARQPDGRLDKILAGWHGLTEAGQEMLRAEFARRGRELLLPPPPTPPPPEPEGPEPPPRDFPPGEPVLLRRFRDLPEAQLSQAKLDSAGITNYLIDDEMVRLDWRISNLLGGVKLVVHASAVEEARRMLDERTPEKIELDSGEEFEQPRCPKCGSVEIKFEELNKFATYLLMMFGAPIPIYRDKWTCEACGVEWQVIPDKQEA